MSEIMNGTTSHIIYALFLRHGDIYDLVGFAKTAQKAGEWATLMLNNRLTYVDIKIQKVKDINET